MQANWIDITMHVTSRMVCWPGDDPVMITRQQSIGENGASANVTHLSMSAHTGTHIDAPLHFFKQGKDVTEIDFDTLIGPVKLIAVTNPQNISLAEIKEYPIESGDRIIIKTKNSDADWSRKPFMTGYVYLSTPAARWLVERGIKTIGVDYLSVAGMDNGTEVHQLLLGAGITVIEGLKLEGIAPGQYEMMALPMKIKNSDGAPARVLIRKCIEVQASDH